jgi:hypothetical protein
VIRIYINNRDRLTWTQNIVADIRRMGGEPVIIDNLSSYPPLLDWYATKPCEVFMLEQNHGPRAPWTSGIATSGDAEFFGVTDPDLDLSGIPDDGIQHLCRGLERHPSAPKAGFSLELNDLPEGNIGNRVREYEAQYWTKPLTDGFYDAYVDTTFAVYARGRSLLNFYAAVRSDRPYTARHLPWYGGPQTDDEKYYVEHAERLGELGWTRWFREGLR